jgi:cell shape-determining protein MreC
VAIVDTVTRIPQGPFAEVTARPAARLNQVREIMLIWSAPKEDEPEPGELPVENGSQDSVPRPRPPPGNTEGDGD